MTDHEPRTVERHCEVCIVGGSAAGLAAALQLGRQLRSTIVVDDGEPRNRAVQHTHGYLAREGMAPPEFLAAARDEVRSYGGEILAGRAVGARRRPDGRFCVELAGGQSVVARRVLAATGLVDRLPDIEGLAQHWGGDVLHCPFCHGFEVRDRRLVQIVTHPAGLHPSALLRQLTSRLTLVVDYPLDAGDARLDALRAGGTDIRGGRVRRIVTRSDGRISAVELADGGRVEADAVVVAPRFEVRAEPFVALGLRPSPHPSGLGEFVETDSNGETAVPGLYAAGNVTDPSQQLLHAAAHGSRVGAMICMSLADEDLRDAARPSRNQADWDHRYSGGQLWSGNPNGSLVEEAAGLTPGRALDVGAGEGGDALWLAERGWAVTASDISERALERIQSGAERRGLPVVCRRADANALDAFDGAAFDLVSAHYASIPRTPDDRAVHNLLNAVAPGGTLLVVGHDLDAMGEVIPESGHRQPFDPDAYVKVDDFAAALSGSSSWQVQIHERRPRPAGSASGAHHVSDIVLRARRLAG